ncbi:MAG TPA: CBS domain-containing protein [Polyangiales bacterium]
MTTKKPTVQQYMSRSPLTIGRDQPLSRAHAVMREHAIRHLPVLEGGSLIGMLSQNDLYLVESLPDVDARQVSVEEAMSREVYAVPPETPLVDVARTMADSKLSSAVIMQGQHVLGVFTGVDLARALARLLDGEPAPDRAP